MPRKNRTGLAGQRPSHAESAGKTGRSPRCRGEVRIIGGEWRGRRLHFPSTPAVATHARSRSRDGVQLAAGRTGRAYTASTCSRAAARFGLEALSRGAAAVEFVEADRVAAGAIEQSLHAFGATTGRVICEDAFAYLASRTPRGFDVVFVDPPYAEKWRRTCLLEARVGRLARDGRVDLPRRRRESWRANAAGRVDAFASKKAGTWAIISRDARPHHDQS